MNLDITAINTIKPLNCLHRSAQSSN